MVCHEASHFAGRREVLEKEQVQPSSSGLADMFEKKMGQHCT